MSEHKNAPAVEEAPETQVSKALEALTGKLDALAKKAEDNPAATKREVDETFEAIRKEQKRLAEQVKTKSAPDVSYKKVNVQDVIDGKTNHELTKEFQRLNDEAVYRQVLRGNVQVRKNSDGEQVMILPKDASEWKGIPEYDEMRTKANTDLWWTDPGASDAGDGREWVPIGMANQAEEFYAIRGDLLGILQRRTIPRGVGSFSIPVLTTEQGPDLITEQSSAQTGVIDVTTVGNGTTAVATLSPKKHLQTLSVTVEGTEDMAVESLGVMRRALAQNLVGAVEESVINGQAASDTDLDDAPGTSGLVSADGYSASDGSNSFRLHAVVNSHTNTASGGNITAAMVLDQRQDMGKYGVRPGELAFVTSPVGYLSLLQDTNVLTVDKFGSGASILAGQLASIAGVPVFVSDKFPEDIAATGIDAGTGATTGAILFNRTQWTLGIAREMSMAMVPNVGYDIVNIVGSIRSHFVNHRNTERTCDYLINVA